MGASFRFKRFEVSQDRCALKLGTDAVLLGTAVRLSGYEENILDIGTGCGVIALILAQRCPQARICGVDIDAPSVEDAAQNFAASPWAQRLDAVCADIQAFAPPCKYDLIVSNHPYYDSSLRNPDDRVAAARHTFFLSPATLCRLAAQWLTSAEDADVQVKSGATGGPVKAPGRLAVIIPEDSLRLWRRIAASFGLHAVRLLHIRTTSRKAPMRVIVEFSLGKRCIDPAQHDNDRSVPAHLDRTDTTQRDIASMPHASTPAPHAPAACLEEELVLTHDGARTPEYAALTADFYL